ncbi:EamA family transporter [Salmonella enterica subsp. enterica serovar Tamberma]|nr:EamA family transporter [Salmonella enterica subsp. enterica serovar Tamberma]
MTPSTTPDAMTLSVFCILLFAALLHASWNAIVKAGNDKLYAAIGVSGSAAVMALILLPFSPQPAHASIPFLAASTALQVVYTVLVALISVLFLGDSLSSLAWVGIAVICMAILGMACNGRASSQRGVVLALTNACFIAGYTLVDGTGVRLSETALGYTLWSFFLNGACLLTWAMIARRREASRYLAQQWKKGIFGGIGTMGSYGLALWAMTQAPLAVVAALRETSILFGALIAWLLLKEKVAGLRLVAAGGIALGAILLRLS